jgi:hypothetical protein
LSVALYAYETLSLTLSTAEQNVFKYRMLKRIFGLEGDKVTEGVENCIMIIYFTLPETLLTKLGMRWERM